MTQRIFSQPGVELIPAPGISERTRMGNKGPAYNESGDRDLTAYKAISNCTKAEKALEKKMAQTVGIMKLLAEVLGFKIDNRIILVDKKTGKRYE